MVKQDRPIWSLDEPVGEPERNPYAGRLWAMRVVILLLFVALGVQLWRLQIVEGPRYRELADNNRFRQTRIEAARGVMYDRNGILLVRNVPSYAVAIVPADLPDDPQVVFRRLGFLIGKSPESIAESVLAPPKGKRATNAFTPVIIDESVTHDVAFAVEERHVDLPGVEIVALALRDYLDGRLTAHVIGYVGRISPEEYERVKGDSSKNYSASDRLGQTGLEYSYESVLRGRVGQKQTEVDYSGREVRVLAVDPPEPGHNLRLTIDLALQREVNRIAMEQLGKYQSVSIVAMDPRNGQILAMVSAPTYDNNLFSGKIGAADFQKLVNDPTRPLVNHAISDVYAPGSTFKIVTAAGAMEKGVVAASTQIDCEGAIYVESEYARTRFVCWGAHHAQDIISGLANSCDIYFYHLGGGPPKGEWRGLGVAGMHDWAKLFGLGDPTGIDLPGEASGNIPTAEWKKQNWKQDWFLGDTYNMAIGQGFVTTTPLQMLNVVAAATNGGKVYKPQLVKEISSADGKAMQTIPPQLVRTLPVSKYTLELITAGLRANMVSGGVSPWGTSYVGTAYTAEVPGLRIGGKTGTAEHGLPDAQGVMATHGWFVGVAPIENPTIAVVAFVETGSGSRDAAELVETVMRYYFKVPLAAGGGN